MDRLKLIGNENLLQLVMDNIPTYIFWKDRDSIYMGCNKNFALSAGFKNSSAIIGKSDYDLPWSREEADFFRSVDKRVMDSGKEELNFEEPQTISNGETRWLKTSKIPLRDADGNVIGILGTYEDITVKKQLEMKLIENSKALEDSNTTLKQLILDLERANIDLEQFAYATSHDLQEPLRMIGSFVTLLKRRYKEQIDQEGAEYFDFITEGVQRMSNLIKGVLLYSRLEKDEEEFKAVDLNACVEEKLKDLEVRIKNSNTQLQLNLPNQKISCSPLKIGILFYNLILNGIKFNTSKTPQVSVYFEERPEEWFFTVEDNGIGIEQLYEDKVFQPFKRLNNRSEFPGNGIGLSICKRIVTIHKGKIWFENNDLGGTNFYFTINKKIGSR